MKKFQLVWLAVLLLIATVTGVGIAQETTGGLQGTVKDPSGAVVPNTKVVITGTSLVGSKNLVTDSSGYYRFANLPPGTYTITATAQGFNTYKRDVVVEVGHLPTVNVALQVGAAGTTVEVNASAPVIDTTTTENMTNITKEELDNVAHGISYQSVIQFAPMARNEPLAGMSSNGTGSGGTGGSMPGSSGNGLSYGFSIGGAADSETSYLVEGQDTENISGGYSKANVPMQFIDQVEVKTSGISAEYGGALGGVVNVVMKKGSNGFHGELYASYESSGTDANPTNPFLRYDPSGAGAGNTPGTLVSDPNTQEYQASKDHFRTVEPGFMLGGPILKDKVWFYAGFEPLVNSVAKSVNFDSTSNFLGQQYFTSDRQTYFGTLRLDAALTSKIRVFASWLYQYARETGDTLPVSDPTGSESSYLNPSINSPILNFSHGLGFSAPDSTYNFGADITITPKIISTTRFGYFFENYHDFGWQTSTPNLVWETSGSGGLDNAGNALPANLQQVEGYSSAPYTSTYTKFNANKHYQLNQDVAFYKGTRWGTHNLKVGYQLNHLVNVIDQNGNVPLGQMTVGAGHGYNPLTATGGANCATLTAEWGGCTGQYGYTTIQDFSTILTAPASDWNHAFYAQDSWTVGHGLTIDAGLRIEKESLPAPGGVNVPSIDFSWGDKIEPRVGAAWDPSHTGKMKFFGSYGVVNDVMKLLLAQTSWGAQAYEDCTYALGPDSSSSYSNSDIDVAFVNGRACPNGPATTNANFANGKVPTAFTDKASGVSLIENVNERPWEPVAPGVKPYRQHEFVVGGDYQISNHVAFEVRYDRRRLDHVIEDASLSDVNWGETYAVVNPGEGVNSTINGYANYLASLGQAFGVPGWQFDSAAFGSCGSCPPNPKAIRNYDGVEMRVTKTQSQGWSGMFSYTYSSLWGNYTGLTTTDQTDGGTTGRNSPDTTRSFDEPFYYFGANGKSTSGPLPTDRPNVFKGNVYYRLPWGHRFTTTVGLFQVAYQGSPVSSYIDLIAASTTGPYEATYIYGRGQWVDVNQNTTSGAITLGTPYARRTPWYTQSDFNLGHEVKINDHQTVSFEAVALNVLNQRAVTAYWGGIDSQNWATAMSPGPATLYSGAALYKELESGYNVSSAINSSGVVKNSWYGQPYLYQNARSLRLAAHFRF